MGLFSGGAGFQGPGEEFGNSWDSFKTGRGNFMTDSQGNTSNAGGVWSHTGGRSPYSGPNQLAPTGSPIPGARPDPNAPQAGMFDGLLGGGILGMIDNLTSNGLLGMKGRRMDRQERASRERGLKNTVQETFNEQHRGPFGGLIGSIFGGGRGV